MRLKEITYQLGQKKPDVTFCYIDVGLIDNKSHKISNNQNIIEPDNAPSRARKIVRKGTILYSTVRPYLQNICILEDDFPHPPIASTAFAAMETFKGIHQKFLLYYLLSPVFTDFVSKSMVGVAYPAINDENLYNIIVPLPPISEQKRIIAKIEELLPFIEQYAKKEQELTALHQAFPERLKKSILQAAIQGKLTEQNPNDEPAIELIKRIQVEKERLILEKKIKKPKQRSEIIVRDNSHYEIVDGVERCIDDEIPFEIPESWCWVRLGDIFEITSSKRVHQSEWQSSGIPFYRAREIVSLKKKEKLRDPIFISKDIYDKNTTISGKPQIGDLLVTGVGTLGQAFLVENKSPFYFKDGNVVWFKNFSQIYTSYILYFMESSFFIEQIYSKSQGTTVGTFTIENAKNIFMPFPPLSEQQRIVSKIEKLFSSLENLTK